MSKLCKRLLIFILLFIPISGLSKNTSIHLKRSSDSYLGATDAINRQYPIMSDMSFLLPHLIVGVFIPIAVIIGIGVVLMKLFIIGFMLLGKGGYGMGPNLVPYGPWRVDQVQQQHIQRSLLDREGRAIPNYLSTTLWNLIEKVSNSLDNYQKHKS